MAAGGGGGGYSFATAIAIFRGMKVIIQGKQLKLSEGLKRYAEEHLVQQLTRFYDDEAAELRVELGRVNGSKAGSEKECHLTLRIPGVRAIQVEEVTTDAYASLDRASERLVRTAKEELSKRRRASAHRQDHPLAKAVAEGGVPAGLAEELPNTLAGAARGSEEAPPPSRPGRKGRSARTRRSSP